MRESTSHIYSIILDRICLLEYPPGTVLREGALAEEFGTSRTPIREVFLRLSLLGLVESRNGVGTFVTGMDYTAYRDIYAMRLRVAELIGELCPRAVSAADIRAVQDLLQRTHALGNQFDIRTYWNLNHELHFTISSLIGNSALRELWDRYYFQTARIWYAIAARFPDQTAEAFTAEVEATLRAMRADDSKAIGYVQRNFIADAMRKVMDEVDPDTGLWWQEAPFDTPTRDRDPASTSQYAP